MMASLSAHLPSKSYHHPQPRPKYVFPPLTKITLVCKAAFSICKISWIRWLQRQIDLCLSIFCQCLLKSSLRCLQSSFFPHFVRIYLKYFPHHLQTKPNQTKSNQTKPNQTKPLQVLVKFKDDTVVDPRGSELFSWWPTIIIIFIYLIICLFIVTNQYFLSNVIQQVLGIRRHGSSQWNALVHRRLDWT